MQLYALVGGNMLALALLVAGEAALTSAGNDPAAVYKQHCAMCHGATGGGNGPAAVAFDPKPTDFTTVTFQESRTDDQLTEAIAKGRGTMPGFEAQLQPDDLKALVSYIREMRQESGANRARQLQW
jgi:high-affinity iron transporter